MNSRRSYLDTINAGRRRRASSSIEELAQSLDELQKRIAQPGDPARSQGGSRPAAHSAPPPVAERDNYRMLARDLERSRRQEEGLHEAGRIAGDLRALREELHREMAGEIRQEFAALRSQLERAVHAAQPERQLAQFSAEFERLSGIVADLAERGDERQAQALRLEMEQVKTMLGRLAREETLQSVDRRWEDFDRRWDEMEARVAAAARSQDQEPAIAALDARLQRIGEAVAALPDSAALRSLEDKLKVLSLAVDDFSRRHEHASPQAFEALEERLDEITRAIAASAPQGSAPAAVLDPQPFERIEARIASLARQIGEVVEDHPASGLAEHVAALSRRVDDLAQRVELPEHVAERLADQIALISRKLDAAPATPDFGHLLEDLDRRFGNLSEMLERRHEDALSQGQVLFRELERRLGEVAGRIDGHDHARAAEPGVIEAIDARFAELAQRLETHGAAGMDDTASHAIESRLHAISERLEASARQHADLDPDLIRSLQTQVETLSAHVLQPGSALPELEDIAPRLSKIERSIAQSREEVLTAARMAAEEAARSMAAHPAQGALVSGLAADLQSLDALTRRADERNTRTFEAIHDTLLKIVDRLGAVESGTETRAPLARQEVASAPPLDPDLDEAGPAEPPAQREARPRTPALAAQEAAAEAARADRLAEDAATKGSSLLSRLAGRMGAGKAAKTPTARREPEPLPAPPAARSRPGLDEPLAPVGVNEPLEPGSGAPDLQAIMRRVRDESGHSTPPASPDAAKSDFIAAARRAAQAAAAEAEQMKKNPQKGGDSGRFVLARVLGKRTRPILVGVLAVLVALAGLQAARSYLSGGERNAQHAADQAAPVPQAGPQDAVTPTVRMIGEAPGPQESTAEAVPGPIPSHDGAGWLEDEPAAAGQAAAADETPDEAPDAALAEAPAAAGPAVPQEIAPAALREAASAGEAAALFEIGNRYAQGIGVERDLAAAAQWYEMAAERGLAVAQYRIANMYDKGTGVARDSARARTLYQLAAAQGNAGAMHNLAVLLAMGADGVPDNESAVRWFQEAADLGVRDSQFNLGILTAKGVGTPQDLIEAYKWFAIVADSGDADAAAKRDEVAAALRPDQLETARATARLWQAQPLDAQANEVEIPAEWAPVDDTVTSSVEISAVDMRAAIRNVQTILGRNGYDAGPADGIMGERTKTAIAAFQRDNAMQATGEIDEALVRALLERR